MKAVVVPEFGPPEVLRCDDIPKPTPKPGEALLRIHASGVNRLDVEMRAGVYGGEPLLDFYFGKEVRFPHILGVEPAGVIEAIGEGVENLKVGERAMPFSHVSCGHCAHCLAGFDNACARIQVLGVQTPGKGGYAEYITWPANRLVTFTEELSFEKAAALLVNYGPVWFGLAVKARLSPGETLLVTGATGGCGIAAIQIGRLLGARVIAVSSREEKRTLLTELGADEVVIGKEPGWGEEVLEMTKGEGANVVCELVGAATWKDSCTAASILGRIAVIGSHSGIKTELNLGELFGKNLSLLGITRSDRGGIEKVARLAELQKLRPHVWKSFALTDAHLAHRAMERREHTGKIVLTVS